MRWKCISRSDKQKRRAVQVFFVCSDQLVALLILQVVLQHFPDHFAAGLLLLAAAFLVGASGTPATSNMSIHFVTAGYSAYQAGGMRFFIGTMLQFGCTEEEVALMAKINPAKLPDLEPLE